MATAAVEDLHPDLIAGVIRLLDGPTLASLSCANVRFRSLAGEPDLWRDLCLSSWPSLGHPRLLRLFASSHRSFFADVFPSPVCTVADFACGGDGESSLPSELISAVDLRHRGSVVLSLVVETDTSTSWFMAAPFRIDADAERKGEGGSAVFSPEELTLSWVVIDPHHRRAVSATSRRPVTVDRHWITGEMVVRFALVLGEECAVVAVVKIGEETGQVREIYLVAEGVEGACLSGREGLAVLRSAMEGGRRRGEEHGAKKRWEEFSGRRQKMKETAAKMERLVDLACAAVGAAAFLALFALAVAR
ncbi:probable F-box protein At2g36090 [Zingiber officinale]|uniref:probable F-box protein At2g36090 n=1 Tax=Zingiber officinale TaxID=94328 RepID=UPI001C4CED01|nr:probable F-box protein At2g36090 [Zingiber officinale]